MVLPCPALSLTDGCALPPAMHVSSHVFPALPYTAWHGDRQNYSLYLKNNIFLADINNERAVKNATYKTHMTALNTYALLYSTTDMIVVPRSSPWFQFYAEGQDTRVVAWNESESYRGDWLGLRTLAESGRLLRWQVNCSHSDIPRLACKPQSYDAVVRDLLNNTLP